MSQYPHYHIVVPGQKKLRNGGKMESVIFFFNILKSTLGFGVGEIGF